MKLTKVSLRGKPHVLVRNLPKLASCSKFIIVLDNSSTSDPSLLEEAKSRLQRITSNIQFRGLVGGAQNLNDIAKQQSQFSTDSLRPLLSEPEARVTLLLQSQVLSSAEFQDFAQLFQAISRNASAQFAVVLLRRFGSKLLRFCGGQAKILLADQDLEELPRIVESVLVCQSRRFLFTFEYENPVTKVARECRHYSSISAILLPFISGMAKLNVSDDFSDSDFELAVALKANQLADKLIASSADIFDDILAQLKELDCFDHASQLIEILETFKSDKLLLATRIQLFIMGFEQTFA